MNEEEKRHLAISAAMEGKATIVANIGDKVEVSSMELICLVNFAEIGVMSIFSKMGGAEGADAKKELKKHINALRREFAAHGEDGLTRLMSSTCAMLRSEKFQQLMVG